MKNLTNKLKEKQKVQKNEKTESQSFEQLIADYNNYKKQEKEIVDKCKKLNTSIKEYMIKNELSEVIHDNIKVTYTNQERYSLDEEKLLKIVKGLDGKTVKDFSLIVTVEKVDMQSLENCITNEKIDAKILIPAQNKKIIPVLNIKDLTKKGE